MRHPTPDAVGPGQESVWDYPRPPGLDRVDRLVKVRFDDHTIADATHAFRVLETSHPPTYYLPAEFVDHDRLAAAPGGSMCEWKGAAAYFDVIGETRRAERAAWFYPEPTTRFAALAGCLAFYPGSVECTVDGETVTPQPGKFYGGWVTSDVVGPFKGEPGTQFW